MANFTVRAEVPPRVGGWWQIDHGDRFEMKGSPTCGWVVGVNEIPELNLEGFPHVCVGGGPKPLEANLPQGVYSVRGWVV